MIQYFLYFIIYGFLGWCMETIRFSIREKRFVNRGFLHGPICPIYGVGMVLIILLLEPFHNSFFELFFLGMIFSTVLEYFTGFILEKAFYTRWWDYSSKPYNLQGYICLANSLAWGVLSVIMIHFVQPIIENILEKLDGETLNYFSIAILIIMIIDSIIVISGLINFKKYIGSLSKIEQKLEKSLSNNKEYQKVVSMYKDGTMSVEEYLKHIKDSYSDELKEIKSKYDKASTYNKENKKSIKRLYNNYQTKIKDNVKYSEILEVVKKELKK